MKQIIKYVKEMTMYRLMLYFLLGLVIVSVVFAAVGWLAYDPVDILIQAVVFAAVCWFVNRLFARHVKTKVNPESAIITGLILSLIVGPYTLSDGWFAIFFVAVMAMASKYIITRENQHILNPAAFGAFAAALVIGEPASWWIGSMVMFPFIALGGLIVLTRIRRVRMVLVFLAVFLGLFIAGGLFDGRSIGTVFSGLQSIVLSSSLLFFALVMLVEPMTSPKTRKNQVYFASLVALVIFGLQKFFPSLVYSFEIALVVGNVFSFAVSGDFRQTFYLQRKEDIAKNIKGFWFRPARPFDFVPGQFLEYSLPHENPDSRGVRRWFTIASSPTEKQVLLATKFAEEGSSFKNKLKEMQADDEIVASQVQGDFVLPEDDTKKIIFIAGGIGVTPYRSMIKYLLDQDESRDIVLLYGANSEEEFAFQELFQKAEQKIGLKAFYKVGNIDEKYISEKVGDYKDRIVYVSGPEPMVEAFEKKLEDIGFSKDQIRTDFFPGYEEI